MVKKNIPLAAVEKIMKSAGASRVADKAKTVMRDALEDMAEDIAQNAAKYAIHSKHFIWLQSPICWILLLCSFDYFCDILFSNKHFNGGN